MNRIDPRTTDLPYRPHLPPSYTLTPPAMKDAPLVHAMMIACDWLDFGCPNSLLEDVVDSWTELGPDLTTNAWIVRDAQQQIAGYADLTLRSGGRYMMDAYVHPDQCGRGIGTSLVRTAETRARALDAATPLPNATVYNGIPSSNSGAAEIVLREGFTLARCFFRMELDLGREWPNAPMPEGYAIRTFQLGIDTSSVHDAREEAFADHWNHTPEPREAFEQRHLDRESFDPSLWFIITTESGEPAGIALCRNTETEGFVDTLGVRPAHRRQGLGGALLATVFDEFRRRGTPLVALNVDAQSPTNAVALYERAGMRIAHRYDVYSKPL